MVSDRGDQGVGSRAGVFHSPPHPFPPCSLPGRLTCVPSASRVLWALLGLGDRSFSTMGGRRVRKVGNFILPPSAEVAAPGSGVSTRLCPPIF